MKVREIMSSPVSTIAPTTEVRAIARLLVDNGISSVPVVDDQGQVVGMVTESDLIVRNANLHFPRFLQILDARVFLEGPRHFEEELRRMLGVTAEDVMSAPVISVSPDDDIERAATLMWEKRIHALPVLQGGRLVGIVSEADIVRLIANEAQTE